MKALTVVILQVTISLLEAAMRDSGKRKFLIDGAGLHTLSGASYAQAFQVNPRRSCTGPAGTDEVFFSTPPGFPRNEENRSNFESQVTLADAAT